VPKTQAAAAAAVGIPPVPGFVPMPMMPGIPPVPMGPMMPMGELILCSIAVAASL